MRKIKGLPVLFFLSIFTIGLIAGILGVYTLEQMLGLWRLSEVLSLALFLFIFVLIAIFSFRVFFYFFPVPRGEITQGTKEEKLIMLYQLFMILCWRPFFQTKLVPVPLTRLVYILLGSKVGEGTYFPGVVGDPLHFKVGSHTILGEDSLVICHAIEGDKMAFYDVELGNRVTIGAKSIIMAGVRVEDHAIVAAGSVVTKHSHIRKGEIWAGAPAAKIGQVNKEDLVSEIVVSSS